MAAGKFSYPWECYVGTISTYTEVIWEISIECIDYHNGRPINAFNRKGYKVAKPWYEGKELAIVVAFAGGLVGSWLFDSFFLIIGLVAVGFGIGYLWQHKSTNTTSG